MVEEATVGVGVEVASACHYIYQTLALRSRQHVAADVAFDLQLSPMS
jgi:hypothetical protein